MVMLLPLLCFSTTLVLQFSVCSAIRCVVHEYKSNHTVKQCDSNYKACSVLWTGPTAKEAVLTSRACWNHAETRHLDNCPFGPCIPRKLEVTNLDAVAYFCCCQGDLCNKIPGEIKIPETTDPPISDPRVQDPDPLARAWWYTPCIAFLSALLVLAAIIIAAYVLLQRRRRRNSYIYQDVEARRQKPPKIDLTKQLCGTHDSFPHQMWLGSYRPRHLNKHLKQTNNNHSVSLLGEENLTVRVSDQASAVRWARETRVLSSVTLTHSHVVSVLWWGKKHRKSWLVYRDVYVGTLTHVLQNCSLSIEQVKKLSECIFSGLAYLHCTIHAGARSKIALAHGDMRSDNILLKPNYIPVLGNLHNATKLQYSNFDKLSTSVESISKLMPTNHYLAPELFTRGRFLFDNSYRQMDVYSASLVVWQIINRCIDGGALPFSLPYEQYVGSHPTLGDMSEIVPDTRPTLHAVWLQHPELKKLCWLVQLAWKAVPSQRLTAHCIHRLLRDPVALDALCGGRTQDTSF
ncbi:activin receptor type-2B-like isoform X2 [Bolinopsis microptera]|uniref:activin receptor type-2B-like isoform X2 n=1 Tax=Bolinopsis microptera TaxID=2820187 RepID=UPI00307AAB3E